MASDEERTGTFAGIPRAVLLAWRAAPATTKGPKPRWTLEQILDAAVRLGDDEGIEAITMSGLAKALGSGTMSLYRYVESREDLIVLAADHALGAPAAPHGATWRDRLRSWVLDLRAVYVRHPWLTAIPVGTEPLLPSFVRRLESGLECVDGLGLAGARAVTVLTMLWTYTRGDSEQAAQLAAVADRSAGRGSHQDLNTVLSARLRALSQGGSGLERVLGVLGVGQQPESAGAPSGGPAANSAVIAGERTDEPEVDEFLAAIEIILDGLEARQQR